MLVGPLSSHVSQLKVLLVAPANRVVVLLQLAGELQPEIETLRELLQNSCCIARLHFVSYLLV